MHKIDGPGATGSNEWTEGNPSLGIPATVVTDDFMNTVQRELVEVVEFAGLTLNKPDDTQVRQAIQALIGEGGGDQLKITVANNQAAPTDVTDGSNPLLLDKSTHVSMHAKFAIERNTDTEDFIESGEIRVTYDPVADDFVIDWQSSHEDAGVTFSVTSAGQVQYVSTNMAGANYVGNLRIMQVIKAVL